MALATGAPRRIGFRRAREFGWLGLTDRHEVHARHTVDRMLELLEYAGVPPVRDLTLYPPAAAIDWWEAQQSRTPEAPYAVLAPTSRWPSKAWPVEHWRSLARGLLERGWKRIVVVAAPNEREAARAATLEDPAVTDLAGATSIGQMMAVIRSAALVVANDSAPLHMAVGFSRPLLALFGPTDPEAVGPYGRISCVLRSEAASRFSGRVRDPGLDDRLMREVQVPEVLEALDAGRQYAGLPGVPA